MSWEPLASSDPVPGDPARVTAVADQLRQIAASIEEQSGRLRGITAEAFWEGDAADRFEADKEDLPPLLDVVRRRYGEVGSALARYAPELAAAQETARRALAQARGAEADIASAERGIDRMEEYAADERARVRAMATAYPDRPPPRPVPWSGPNYRALLGDAQTDLAAARALLDQAIEQNQAAARTAAGAIYRSIDDEIRNTSRSRAEYVAQVGQDLFSASNDGRLRALELVSRVAEWTAYLLPIEEISAVAGVLALFLPQAAVVKLALDAVLWVASGYDEELGKALLVETAIALVVAKLRLIARAANSVSQAAVRATVSDWTPSNAIYAARSMRTADRLRLIDSAASSASVIRDVTGPGLWTDIQTTVDIYHSQSLLMGSSTVVPGSQGTALFAAAWMYHNRHRGPPPKSIFAPVDCASPVNR